MYIHEYKIGVSDKIYLLDNVPLYAKSEGNIIYQENIRIINLLAYNTASSVYIGIYGVCVCRGLLYDQQCDQNIW